jgi:hypothetical protein
LPPGRRKFVVTVLVCAARKGCRSGACPKLVGRAFLALELGATLK